MNGLEIPVHGVDWDILDEFLSSDRAPPDCMSLPELDGFMTAVAIGPELIPPSEWMPVIWGDGAPSYTDEEEMLAVLGGMMSRYNEILTTIGDGSFEPILWEDTDGSVIPVDWAEGFLAGAGLRAAAWEPLFQSEEDGFCMVPILSWGSEEFGDAMFEESPEAADELWDSAATLLPASVLAVAAYWKQRGQLPLSKSARKQGRNDPCACGSGQKFKKCCGR